MQNILKALLRTEAAVIVNSKSNCYRDFCRLIKPYLDNFGVPYVAWDIAEKEIGPNIRQHNLIIIGHRQIGNKLDHSQQKYLLDAVKNGSGLLNFECDINTPDYSPRYQFIQDIFAFSYANQHRVNTVEFIDSSHYITVKHEKGEVISFDNAITPGAYMNIPGIEPSEKSRVLVTCGGNPFIIVTSYGRGRVVQWAGYDWISSKVHGQVWGMDDLIWRSFVWASRKPFVMQGMPPFAVLRVDDCQGIEKNNSTSPFNWVKVANKYGFKPWLGLFIDNMSNEAIKEIKELVKNGKATAIPHAFSTEKGIYFDISPNPVHGPISDEEIGRRIECVRNWINKHEFSPVSKCFIPHWYEAGTNAYPYVEQMGYQFVSVVMPVNKNLVHHDKWLIAGPYRLYDKAGKVYGTGKTKVTHPFFYADYLEIPTHPEYEERFFNVITEIRDDNGYEWFSAATLKAYEETGDVSDIVQHAINQSKRAFDSMVLMGLFSHEGGYLSHISPPDWEKIMARLTSGIADYNPIYVTLDYAYQYVRAKHNSKIEESVWDPENGRLSITYLGKTDMPTMVYLFNEEGGDIAHRFLEVPQLEKATTVEYERPQWKGKII